MLISVYYQQNCVKCRFLRACLRVMDWEIHEVDIDDPASSAELLHIKSAYVGTDKLFVPAVLTSEVFSHELQPIIEYVNDRCPEGMYPTDVAHRLFARSFVLRELRRLNELWPAYSEKRDPTRLLALYDNIYSVIVDLLPVRMAWRPLEERPTFIEMFFYVLQYEVYKYRPAASNKHSIIDPWFAQITQQFDFSGVFERIS